MRPTVLAAAALLATVAPCLAQDAPPADRERDRGPGVPTSMFGTYIEKGQVNSRFRFFAGVEGSQDEVEAITEAQVFVTPRIILKLNNAADVTSNATDWAPEVGVTFVFP